MHEHVQLLRDQEASKFINPGGQPIALVSTVTTLWEKSPGEREGLGIVVYSRKRWAQLLGISRTTLRLSLSLSLSLSLCGLPCSKLGKLLVNTVFITAKPFFESEAE